MAPVQVHKNLSLAEICKMAPRNVAAEISDPFLLSLQTDVWSMENRVQSNLGYAMKVTKKSMANEHT